MKFRHVFAVVCTLVIFTLLSITATGAVGQVPGTAGLETFSSYLAPCEEAQPLYGEILQRFFENTAVDSSASERVYTLLLEAYTNSKNARPDGSALEEARARLAALQAIHEAVCELSNYQTDSEGAEEARLQPHYGYCELAAEGKTLIESLRATVAAAEEAFIWASERGHEEGAGNAERILVNAQEALKNAEQATIEAEIWCETPEQEDMCLRLQHGISFAETAVEVEKLREDIRLYMQTESGGTGVVEGRDGPVVYSEEDLMNMEIALAEARAAEHRMGVIWHRAMGCPPPDLEKVLTEAREAYIPPEELAPPPKKVDGVAEGPEAFIPPDVEYEKPLVGEDLCPDDPHKTQPGACGCGTPDTDTDGDGTADCNDRCPNDPGKINPGACGCGTPDTDSDGDGTPDCNDPCPNDPDNNCFQDLCPDDPNKTEPGACGCGTPDTDSDGDGTPDCNDLCPNDPAKINPGACGCGTPDTDSDGDGAPDCTDPCPNDPTNTCTGDLCPDDPFKTEPGQCGCGVADTDSDGDGVADCMDKCPNTPNCVDYVDPQGARAGCPSDDDVDGVPNGCDECPDTDWRCATAILPNGCCVDSDADGVCDGCDQSPDTPSCAIVDEFGMPLDDDEDGVPDGCDLCPGEPIPPGWRVNSVGCGIEPCASPPCPEPCLPCE